MQTGRLDEKSAGRANLFADDGGIAQLVERLVRNEKARGSNPLTSSLRFEARKAEAVTPESKRGRTVTDKISPPPQRLRFGRPAFFPHHAAGETL